MRSNARVPGHRDFDFGFAGVGAARAADLAGERGERNVFIHHVPVGRIAAPLVIYDFQPGVVVRAYWLAPWRHRHYFPFGADKAELPPADNTPLEPAETFERYWSTSQTFIRELPPARARDRAPPDEQRFQQAPPDDRQLQQAPPPPPAIEK